MRRLLLINCFLLFALSRILPSKSLAAEMADDRFGLGGNCGIAKELNIAWGYNWGGGVDYPNQNEETCRNTYGRKIFYTLGKESQFHFTYLDNLPTLEQQYLPTEQEKNEYEQLKLLTNKLKLKGLAYAPSAQLSYLLIPKYTTDKPGSYFQIANEPDLSNQVGPSWVVVTPIEYAEYYYLYSKRIKQYDPTAKVMVGGFVSWLPETKYSNADMYAYVREFRQAYLTKYGSNPPVDVWSMHLYIWRTANWQEAKTRLEGLQTFFVSISEGSTPIWLTEFSVGGEEGSLVLGRNCPVHNCLTPEQQEQEHIMVVDSFMKPLVDWLKTTHYVEKWFWFYGGEEHQWNRLNAIGDIYKKSSDNTYNPLGKAYQQLSGSDNTPTPIPLPGDLNGDNKVNLYDYNILVANFGKPYTIFDYNSLVTNFGQ